MSVNYLSDSLASKSSKLYRNNVCTSTTLSLLTTATNRRGSEPRRVCECKCYVMVVIRNNNIDTSGLLALLADVD